MTRSELAWEFAEIFEELRVEEINELVAKNIPLDTLEFMNAYGDDFGHGAGITGTARKRLPNLLLVGYILRLLEERLLDES